jgi:hypothetical protein
MKTVEDGERFNQFVALHKKAVWNQVLKWRGASSSADGSPFINQSLF